MFLPWLENSPLTIFLQYRSWAVLVIYSSWAIWKEYSSRAILTFEVPADCSKVQSHISNPKAGNWLQRRPSFGGIDNRQQGGAFRWQLGGSFAESRRRATRYPRFGRNTRLQTLASSSSRARANLYSTAKRHQTIAKGIRGGRKYFGQSDGPDFNINSVGQSVGQGLDSPSARLKSALDQVHKRLRDA